MRKFAGIGLAVAFLSLCSSLPAQESPVSGNPAEEKMQYLTLEHREPGQMAAEDTALLNAHNSELLTAAAFYGYEMTGNSWNYEQSVCPLMPDSLMLRYSSKDAAGADSIFVALVPRNSGRVRIVPVLTHGATQFIPAARNPRNFQLFNQMVPADTARANSHVDGQWLLLSACYAEMTGAQPQIPNRPGLDLRIVPAPAPTLRIAADGGGTEVRFAAPMSPAGYTLWNVSYDRKGRIVNASADTHSFAPPTAIANIPEPAVKAVTPQPPPQPKVTPQTNNIPPSPPPALQVIPAEPPPAAKVDTPASAPHAKPIREAKAPKVRVIPDTPLPPAKVIAEPPAPTAKVIPDAQPQ